MNINKNYLLKIFLTIIMFLFTSNAFARIHGVHVMSGVPVNLTAKADHISTGDGNSVYFWGYSLGGQRAQYPGPTLILNEGDTLIINLTNNLPAGAGNVSIIFPGHEVTASGGVEGLLTREAEPGGTVSYSLTATNPGTYLYQSGTSPELQVEMGLIGAIIVRPAMGMNFAYNDPDSAFDHEYLFLLSEMDQRIHELVKFYGVSALETTDYLSDYFPVYWFINGRTAPDTMAMENVSWLPTQPYNCMPRMHPGEKLLMRIINAGRDLHPFHHHGNHARVISKDGRLLESLPGAGPDLSYEVFTIQAVPGETVDAIFEWTGKGLGWDIYGDPLVPEFAHNCIDSNGDDFDDSTAEYCPDHGKPFPVVLPQDLDITFGGFYSGSPFLGILGSLPPGEGGMNPNAGFVYMWHSHTEKEMVNFDIFPGGMMTMLIVEPPGVTIH